MKIFNYTATQPRFGYYHPHELNKSNRYRGGIRF